jgi:hypothetical protein
MGEQYQENGTRQTSPQLEAHEWTEVDIKMAKLGLEEE